MRARRIEWLSAVGAALICSGCFKSYVVVSFRPPEAVAAQAVTAATARYAEVRGAVKVVAVRAPGGCANEALSDRVDEGVGVTSRVVLQARCAIWLSELERALAAAGYQVVPWRDLLAAEGMEGAVHLAARKLGVDAVFAVAEIDMRPSVSAGSEAGAVVVSASDPDGALRGPFRLDPGQRRVILALVRERYRDGVVSGFTAAIDAIVLVPPGGEPIWSYRRAVAGALDGCGEPRMLLRGRSDTWRPVLPSRYPAPPADDGAAPDEDALLTRLRGAARTVAADLVARFQKGA